MPIRVLLADDHAVLREGLRMLLSGRPDLEVVGEATNGEEAVQQAEALQPDIVLLDLSMPALNGIEATRRIRTSLHESRVLVLTVHDSEEYVYQALKAGASGYVLKQAAATEIVTAIQTIYGGDYYLSPRISRAVIDTYLTQERRPTSQIDLLSSREREVLALIAEGVPSREIADKLCISPKTVENHRTNIMKKLEVHNRVGLVRAAVRLGLAELKGE